jgi:hypothetical protein
MDHGYVYSRMDHGYVYKQSYTYQGSASNARTIKKVANCMNYEIKLKQSNFEKNA